MQNIPLPENPIHQRLADLHLAGTPLTDAALKLGLSKRRSNAAASASRVWKRADVQAYVTAIRAQAAEGAVLTMREKREFLARVVRVGISALEPGGPNDDLIAEHSTHESEMGSSVKIKRLDPLKAIETDNKLSGEDSESLALQEIAAALSSLAPSVIPQDRM
jgi:hypothetical protein